MLDIPQAFESLIESTDGLEKIINNMLENERDELEYIIYERFHKEEKNGPLERAVKRLHSDYEAEKAAYQYEGIS